MKIKVQEVAYHRNGVSGEGFHVVRFRHDGADMVATVFEGRGQVAVLDVAKLAAGDVGFGSNSWRGDDFEDALRAAVAATDGCAHAESAHVRTLDNGAQERQCKVCRSKFWREPRAVAR